MSRSSPAATASGGAARTRQLVAAPLTPTLLRLAMPPVVVMVAQAAVSTREVYGIGWFGPEALWGCAGHSPSYAEADHVGRWHGGRECVGRGTRLERWLWY